MAVVGALVLSLSATYAKEGNPIRPQVLFHAGRLVSFFLLGGLVGAVGAVFRFGATLVMLGLNLLDIAPWTRRLRLTLPAGLGARVQGLTGLNTSLMPFAVGVATFVLPCGFTQSMQLYALSTGNFLTGATLMLAFALGTLPVLGALSFGAAGFQDRRISGTFFKAAGLAW